MRRGGGSRGGGGGSRSSGYRGHRTSHRHHNRYGRGRYYGRGYGYGYYGYGGSGIGIFIVAFILFILAFGLIISVSTYVGGSNSVNVNLGPGETRLFHPNPNTKDNIEVIDSFGVIQTYFFSSKPPLQAATVDRVVPETLTLPANEYEFFSFYMIKGSQMDVSWNTAQEVEFHIVKGESDYNKWQDGESTEVFYKAGASSTEQFTIDKDNEYYFIFYNSNNADSLTVNIIFNLRAKAYDISNSASMETGSFTKSIGNINYIVFHNPTGSDVSFDYKENSKYSTGTVFLVILGIIIIIAWLIIRKNRSKKKPTQNYVGGVAAGSQVNVHTGGKASLSQQYYQRPQPTFCNACGSGILPNSTFCTECGTKT